MKTSMRGLAPLSGSLAHPRSQAVRPGGSGQLLRAGLTYHSRAKYRVANRVGFVTDVSAYVWWVDSVPGSSSRSVVSVPVGKLKPHLRSQRDYLLFVTRRFWPLAVGITGLAVALVTVVSPQWGIGLSVLALIMTLGIFIIDANNARRESSRVRCGQVVGLFPVQDVKDPLGYGGATYLAYQRAARCWSTLKPIG